MHYACSSFCSCVSCCKSSILCHHCHHCHFTHGQSWSLCLWRGHWFLEDQHLSSIDMARCSVTWPKQFSRHRLSVLRNSCSRLVTMALTPQMRDQKLYFLRCVNILPSLWLRSRRCGVSLTKSCARIIMQPCPVLYVPQAKFHGLLFGDVADGSVSCANTNFKLIMENLCLSEDYSRQGYWVAV